jgi:hypothetical protein
MNTKPFDSVRGAITVMTTTLGFNETYLAGFLGVTEKSLNDWKKQGAGELTPKSKRLKRLYEVIQYIQSQYSNIPNTELKPLLENGRITLDPNDEEDGTTALISFILAEPESTAWVGSVKEAVSDYLDSKPKPKERSIETPTAIQNP